MKTSHMAIAGALIAALTAGATGAMASMDLSKDIEARGAKPAWSLKVTRGTQITLNRAGKPALAATAPGAAISPAGASWTAKSADGQVVKVSVQNGSCAAGGKQYPMTAQVVLGSETLSGCAGYAS